MTRSVFEDWWEKEQGKFHCGHFDTKEIAYSSWLAGQNSASGYVKNTTTGITMSIVNIRNKIMKLEGQLNKYCSHKESSSNGYSDYYGCTIYICKNCGKLFINENIDDLIND